MPYKDPIIRKQKTKEYQTKNKKLFSYRRKLAKLKNLNRVPMWSELDKIERYYLECPEGYQVDHIIPIKGRNVSGLHLLNNLQYLTPEDNNKKQNYFGEYQKGRWTKDYTKQYMHEYYLKRKQRNANVA